jgi:hypothetical protein
MYEMPCSARRRTPEVTGLVSIGQLVFVGINPSVDFGSSLRYVHPSIWRTRLNGVSDQQANDE